MSHSNYKRDLIYQVSLTLRGDLPLKERNKDGIIRTIKAIDMIQNLENINHAFDDLKNATKSLNVLRWMTKNGVYITQGLYWKNIRSADKTGQTQFLDNNPIDQDVNYSFDPSDETNLNYKVLITINKLLPFNERNEDILKRLNKFPDIVQQSDNEEIIRLLDENDMSITCPSRKKLKNIMLKTKSEVKLPEELSSPKENPREVLTDPEEKNPVNTSANQEEYTGASTII